MTFLTRIRGNRADGKIEKLRGLPGLAGLSDDELLHVAAAGELAVVPAGTVLLAEGQLARWCYLVLSGSVEARNNEGSTRRARGAGEAVGDVEVLTQAPSPATVIAMTDLVVVAMGCREFSALLDTCPGFSRAVQVSLSRRASEIWTPVPSPRPVLQLVGGA